MPWLAWAGVAWVTGALLLAAGLCRWFRFVRGDEAHE